MGLFIYSILVLAILFFIGFGVDYIFIPKNLKKFFFWLIPWFGIIFTILFLVVLSFLGLPVKITGPLLIVLSALINIYSIYKKRFSIKETISFEEILMGVCIGLGTIFLLLPLIKISNFPTTISFGNNDIIAYIEGADYLIDNSIQKTIYTITSLGVGDIILGSFRFGPTILYSFFAFIFGLRPFQISYILQATIFPLTAPLIYLLIKIFYKKTYIGLLLSFFITVFNVNLLYMVYHNFFPHTIFRGLMCFTIIFLVEYFNQEKKQKKQTINKFDLIISLSLSAAFFSYQEAMLVFFIIPLGLCIAVAMILKKNISVYLDKLVKISLISLTISLSSIIYSFRFLFYLLSVSSKSQFIGWQLFRSKLPYANPFEAMGFYSIHHFPPMPTLIAILLSLFILATILIGVFRSKFKIYTLIFLIFYVIILIKAWIINPNFFDYGRVLSYTLPLFIILFSIGFISLFKKHKLFLVILLTVLISLELFSARKLYARFLSERLLVDKGYISLKDIQNKNKNIIIKKPIYIENQFDENIPLWNRIWTSYFLSLNSPKIIIASDINPQSISDGSFVLISKLLRNFRSPKLLTSKVVWENPYYEIGYLCNSDSCLLKQNKDISVLEIGNNKFEDSLLISGWGKNEGNSRWATNKESVIRLVTKNKLPAKLTIEVLSLKEPQEVTVYLNKQQLGKISIKKDWENYSLPIPYILNPGVNEIRFIYSNSYKPADIIPGNLDERNLYVNFRRIVLE